ncbi:MAG TPA: heavy metal-binding domain-containing protein [Clostridia bacterium]|nr:heavy metal-binding domain-containing protein [Clostridia bacterium]
MKAREKEERTEKKNRDLASKILVVTVNRLYGFKILQYYDTISSETFIGTGFIAEFMGSIEDVIGGKSSMYQGKMNILKQDVLAKIREQAFRVGANAVIGAEYEYLMDNKNMLMLSISGTPVKIVEED